ncbi:cobalamin-binding protein, partial [Actinosynnema sp. NPDC023658]|uniref:cobalamin-binding protein n=1 Tax=Actinosynnema sp. NPDC023658 TaxID=3155465 RepID=UPI003405BD07
TSGQLVKAVYRGLEQRIPAMARYTDVQRQHTAEDLAHIVDFFAAALYTDDDTLFTGFLTWTAEILDARGVPARHLPPALTLLAAERRAFPRATRILEAARGELSRTLDHGPAA